MMLIMMTFNYRDGDNKDVDIDDDDKHGED